MRVVVALQHHFSKTPEGDVYPQAVFDYSFWRRYLDVFDEVIVLGRTGRINKKPANGIKANGERVVFQSLPDFTGPLQYIKLRWAIYECIQKIYQAEDAYILRVPGTVGTLLWKKLISKGHPYAVEVVGDPWDSLGPGSVRTIFRSFLRRRAKTELFKQCQDSNVASYVTKYSLQKRYPAGDWSTYYSSIELSLNAVVDDSAINARINRIAEKYSENRRWRICFVGSMNQLYKAPDVLIDAVALCINRGMKLELVMVGGGRLLEDLKKRAYDAGIGDHVRLLGLLPSGRAVFNEIDASDLYILPSRQEGLPRSVIEAMARGLPVITTDVGGLSELMEPEWMVHANDVYGLSERIERMLMNVELMTKAVKRNVKIASEYTDKVLRSRRIECYTKLKEKTIEWLLKRRINI